VFVARVGEISESRRRLLHGVVDYPIAYPKARVWMRKENKMKMLKSAGGPFYVV